MAAETINRPVRLPDLCTRALVYISWLCRQGNEVTDGQARFKVEEILRDLDRRGARAGYETRHVRLVIFALVAYADEAILTSTWPGRTVWTESPLQLSLFNINAAGEEFFLRLDHLRRESGSGRMADVLECFLLCLRLGFKGRYGGSQAGGKQLEELIDDLEEDIRQRRGKGHDLGLIDEAPATVPADRVGILPAWVVPTCCAAALILVFGAFSLVLDGRVDGFATAVARLVP